MKKPSLLDCRISVIFRVRSAKAVRITDLDLLKRLGFIVGAFAALLLMRTLVAPPPVVVAKSADDLKAFLCRTDWWDHCFSLSEYTRSSFHSFGKILTCMIK